MHVASRPWTIGGGYRRLMGRADHRRSEEEAEKEEEASRSLHPKV
jgi:hypothetical protein